MTFYFAYVGNKRNELKYIENILPDMTNIHIIVEPFGGSVVFSRYLFDKYHDKKYMIYDIDDDLVYFCNEFYKNDNNIINKSKELIQNTKTKDDFLKIINSIDRNKEDFLEKYLYYKTCYDLRAGLYPLKKGFPTYKGLLKNKDKINEFFMRNKYIKQDFKQTLEQYKNNKDSLIFIDPPYVNSKGNNCYNQSSIEWEYIYDFMNECKCKVILVVNDDFFMKIAFKKYKVFSYEKKYEMSKMTTKHNIFYNY